MIKRLIISLFYRIPFLCEFFLQGKGYIFMLHRVLPTSERDEYVWNKQLSISPEAIRYWVAYFRGKGYDIVSLDEAINRITKRKSRKFIVFTIDDGYKDNFIHGLPIFEELNVPITIYVSNCFPENKAVFWWYFLEQYVHEHDDIDLTSIGVDYKRKYQSEEKKLVYDECRELLRKSNYQTHVNFAKDICSITNLDEINKKLCLSWSEIQNLDKHKLVTIGGHTVHHVSLNNQNDNIAKQEINEGTLLLEKKLGRSINHFAYPYGGLDDVNERLAPILREVGYDSAVLNYPGSIFKRSMNELFDIPRLGLSDDIDEQRINDLMKGRVHLNFNGINKRVF